MSLILLATLMLGTADAPKTLREAASARKLLLGTAVEPRFLNEPDYANVLASEFNMLEAENTMKFEPLHPRPNTDPNPYDFGPADKLVEFAQKHKMKVRGHTLVWHSQVSPWVRQGNFTAPQLSELLRGHIETVTKHYARKVFAWDVVNEAFNDNGTMRSSLWYDRPGIGFAGQGTKFIEQSFRWAHQYDRRAKLFYNDYGAETMNAKSDAIYAMAKDFKERKVPINGIGFQMHLDLNFANPGALDSLRRNIDRFAKLGLEIHITEMDISLKDDSPETLAKQAKLYRDVFDICVAEPKCTSIQIWGFTDKYSWIPGFRRGMGWALPWTDKYEKKPAYDAIMQALTTPRP